MTRRILSRPRRGATLACALALALWGVLVLTTSALATRANGRADAVLGHPDFTTLGCNGSFEPGAPATSATLCLPQAVAVAGSGRLYVADTGNHRVLSWASADDFENGQPAEFVLGQQNFVSQDCNRGQREPAGDTLCAPGGLATDRFGQLYVADSGNNRVLRYARPHVNGQSADLILGQSDSSSGVCNHGVEPARVAAPATLCNPVGVTVDSPGRVYVADQGNNRVLGYARPRANGQPADLVLGQSDFAGAVCRPVTAATLCGPSGVVVDRMGHLYVADTEENRVVRYGHSRDDGQAADIVLGQPNFTSGTCNHGAGPAGPATAGGLCRPLGLAVGPGWRLYVADADNGRLVGFVRPSAIGQAADLVLGQPDFIAQQCNRGSLLHPTASTFCKPEGVAVDSRNNLYVADLLNSRLVRYDQIDAPDRDPQSKDARVDKLLADRSELAAWRK